MVARVMDFESPRWAFMVVDIAMYSTSLTAKFPFTPSRCLNSKYSLVSAIFPFVISVINLNLVPLAFASKIAFFIAQNAKGKDNALPSTYQSHFVFAL